MKIIIAILVIIILYPDISIARQSGNILTDTVAVYQCKFKNTYSIFAAGAYSDEQLAAQGGSNKRLLFYAYKRPMPHTVAVYAWKHATSGAYISVAADEFTDAELISEGYTGKHLQFYAPTYAGKNKIPVYRYLNKLRQWITLPGDGTTGGADMNNYTHKTFQYYGLVF